MPDRLEAMSILVAVVDAGSLSAGARALGLPLATVSRKIAALEAELGAELLLRSARGLTPTDAGAGYVMAARGILDDVAEAERIARAEFVAPRGLLTMTAPIVFGRKHVLPVVTDYLMAYPEVDVRLELTDRPVNLAEEHLDLALRIGALPDSSLVARRLGAVRRVVCASPDYIARHGAPQTPADLAAHATIAFEQLVAASGWRFLEEGVEAVTRIRPRLVVNTAEAAIAAAKAGLGLTRVLSYQIAEDCRAGDLVTVLSGHAPEPWPVSFVYPPRAMMPQKLRAFLTFAVPRISADLAAQAV